MSVKNMDSVSVRSNLQVQEKQKSNEQKSKLKKALMQIDDKKTGEISAKMFFQLLNLSGIEVNSPLPNKYEKCENIPYKEVVHLLQYIYNKEANNFEWVFRTSKHISEKLSNVDTLSTWDIKSVDTRITGYSFSSVKSSIYEEKSKIFRSISQNSEHRKQEKLDNSKLINKTMIIDTKDRSKVTLPSISKTPVTLEPIEDIENEDDVYSITGKIGFTTRKDN